MIVTEKLNKNLWTLELEQPNFLKKTNNLVWTAKRKKEAPTLQESEGSRLVIRKIEDSWAVGKKSSQQNHQQQDINPSMKSQGSRHQSLVFCKPAFFFHTFVYKLFIHSFELLRYNNFFFIFNLPARISFSFKKFGLLFYWQME